MDFRLSEEQQMIRDMARKFADEVIAPRAEEMEATGEYPYDIMDRMAGLGMMGIPFPPQYGGSGGDWVGMHLCIEEISRADVTLGGLLDVTTSVVGQELFVFGTEAQKRKWLVPMAQGRQIGAFGLTEPGAGSDAAATRTTAVLEGDAWVINGTKQFITNIGLDNASIVIITARTKDGRARCHQHLHRAEGHCRIHARQEVRQDGMDALRHARVYLRGLPHPAGSFSGKGGQGLCPAPGRPRDGAHLDCGHERGTGEGLLSRHRSSMRRSAFSSANRFSVSRPCPSKSPTWPCTSNWPETCT